MTTTPDIKYNQSGKLTWPVQMIIVKYLWSFEHHVALLANITRMGRWLWLIPSATLSPVSLWLQVIVCSILFSTMYDLGYLQLSARLLLAVKLSLLYIFTSFKISFTIYHINVDINSSYFPTYLFQAYNGIVLVLTTEFQLAVYDHNAHRSFYNHCYLLYWKFLSPLGFFSFLKLSHTFLQHPLSKSDLPVHL